MNYMVAPIIQVIQIFMPLLAMASCITLIYNTPVDGYDMVHTGWITGGLDSENISSVFGS